MKKKDNESRSGACLIKALKRWHELKRKKWNQEKKQKIIHLLKRK